MVLTIRSMKSYASNAISTIKPRLAKREQNGSVIKCLVDSQKPYKLNIDRRYGRSAYLCSDKIIIFVSRKGGFDAALVKL